MPRFPLCQTVVYAFVAFSLTKPAEAAEPAHRPVEFEVTYSAEVRPGPISARVYVMFGPAKVLPNMPPEPRYGPNWFRPLPFFAVDAKDWKASEPLTVDAKAAGFPGPLDTLEPGEYLAQAVVRLNPDTHKLGDGVGNAYGATVPVTIGPGSKAEGPIKLSVDKVVKPLVFPETDRLKYVEIDSPLLSAFYRRPIKHRAAVMLPEGVEPGKTLPALYIIPGFGGGVIPGVGGDRGMNARVANDPRFAFGTKMIRVILDPDCGTGHHVFADSAYNGPRGRALVEELIPYIEKTFHATPEAKARLLNGHSSGGWSSLWLQVAYPDTFGGVWSTSPDPVDFRDFQKIDLYAPGENMFHDADGKRRPIARMGERAILFYDSFSKMEDVIGEGGQLRSFEAVFSPVGPDGKPRQLWDRATGAVDPAVAKAWETYDIRLVLKRDWATLGPKLKGKIHIVVGDLDTFYLEGAVVLLKAALGELGSDAEINLVPHRDHSNVLDAGLAKQLDQEMEEALKTTK